MRFKHSTPILVVAICTAAAATYYLYGDTSIESKPQELEKATKNTAEEGFAVAGNKLNDSSFIPPNPEMGKYDVSYTEATYTDVELALIISELKSANNFAKHFRDIFPHIKTSEDIGIRKEFYDLLTMYMAGLRATGRKIDDLFPEIESLLEAETDAVAYSRLMLRYQNFMDDESKAEYTEYLLAKAAPENLTQFGFNRIRAFSISNATSADRVDYVLSKVNSMEQEYQTKLASSQI